ncbi:hypothetical protein R3P38DRAFT_2981647 [Favolaschia claudopus]|uniref:Restriction of telomere capping protein 4 C-terminal domain-containing protein n=1 Tax=Favolaschia claudopus TaxID=2862362 RepID=A0AAW0AZL8_9AGAR
MNVKKKITAAETLKQLQEDNRRKDREIARLNRENAQFAKKAAPERRKLIPKPKGEAGTGSGYNVQEAMGLEHDDERYNRLYQIVEDEVATHLNLQNTISKQQPGAVDRAMEIIAGKYAFFRRFAGYWPIKDIMTKYLTNARSRRRVRDKLEKEAEKEDVRKAGGSLESDSDGDDAEAGEEEEEKQVKVKVRRRAKRARVESDSDSEELEEKPSKGKQAMSETQIKKQAKGAVRKRARQVVDDSEEEEEPKSARKLGKPKDAGKKKVEGNKDDETKPTKKPKQTTSERARQEAEGDDKENERKRVCRAIKNKEHGIKRKAKKEPDSPPLIKKVKTVLPPYLEDSEEEEPTPLQWSDLPPSCPSLPCDDLLPNEPNTQILGLFERRQALINEVGETGNGVKWLELEICSTIKKELNHEYLVSLAEKHHWPVTIDWNLIHSRILKHAPEILAMITDKKTLEESAIWTTFLECIDSNIYAFSKASSKKNYTNALLQARCGFYGPKGSLLLQSTLKRIMASEADSLAANLYHTLDSIIEDNPEAFDECDPDCELIELDDFISFILAPHTATLLMALDMDCDFKDANFHRDQSQDYGDLTQADDDDDPVLDVLHHRNIKASKLLNPDETYLSLPQERRPRPQPKPVVPKSKSEKATTSPPNGFKLSPADFEEVIFRIPLLILSYIQVKPKKLGKKESKPTAKLTRAASKPNPVTSDYGTRSKTKKEA